jgi:hypothetical protein
MAVFTATQMASVAVYPDGHAEGTLSQSVQKDAAGHASSVEEPDEEDTASSYPVLSLASNVILEELASCASAGVVIPDAIVTMHVLSAAKAAVATVK